MKTIILCAPLDFGFYDTIKNGLENIGYKVYGFPIEDANYKYKNIYSRIINFLRKVLFQDNNYKNKLKLKERSIYLENLLLNVPNVESTLFIRPDMYPIDFIEKIKKKSKKTIAYHWDSIKRFPHVAEYINMFDRFFLFDRNDLVFYPQAIFTTNFFIPDLSTETIEIPKTAYMIGSNYSNRVNNSITLKNVLTSKGYICNFILKTKDPRITNILKDNNIKTIKESISYSENLKNVKKSEIVIDLHNLDQDGLSFRVFEALNYNKKLITTNPSIKLYDFYYPENIFIWNENNINELELFLNCTMVNIPEIVKSKYNLNNWISYVMDESPYINIDIHHSNIKN